MTPTDFGATRGAEDFKQLEQLAASGELNSANLNEVVSRAGVDLNHDAMSAMSYVATIGEQLAKNYGDSYTGRFVTTIEQFARSSAGQSVGQCSDIHYTMLRTYKALVGGKAKAYLVNFQSGSALNHTNLVIEQDRQIYIVDYGRITRAPISQPDPLRENGRAGQSIAYRVFTENNDETDQMVSHIDSPLGMFLKEVSTGRTSFDPFANTSSYSILAMDLHSRSGTFARIFVGALDGGDKIVGGALNLRNSTALPAGFVLDKHISSALA